MEPHDRASSVLVGIGYAIITYVIVEFLFSGSINLGSLLFGVLGAQFDPGSFIGIGIKTFIGLLGFVSHEVLRYIRDRKDHRYRIIGFIVGVLLYMGILVIR